MKPVHELFGFKKKSKMTPEQREVRDRMREEQTEIVNRGVMTRNKCRAKFRFMVGADSRTKSVQCMDCALAIQRYKQHIIVLKYIPKFVTLALKKKIEETPNVTPQQKERWKRNAKNNIAQYRLQIRSAKLRAKTNCEVAREAGAYIPFLGEKE